MILDYAGANGRTQIDKLSQLKGDYLVQQKFDGSYCHVHLDARGKISRVVFRSGNLAGAEVLGPLLGARVGRPFSILAGELELYSECATRSYQEKGYRVIHLFDCLRDGDRYLAREPYSVRRDALWRMQAQVADDVIDPFCKDANGAVHDRATGRYTRDVPTGWRLTPIVPQMPLSQAGELWERAKVGLCEGLVVVNQKAPASARRAKLKVKPTRTLDARVLEADAKRVRVEWKGYTFVVGQVKAQARAGQVWELKFDGFYESAVIPKFARLVRQREDLRGV